MSGEALHELRKCFLEAYDENNDGKIDIREVTSGNEVHINKVFREALHRHCCQRHYGPGLCLLLPNQELEK